MKWLNLPTPIRQTMKYLRTINRRLQLFSLIILLPTVFFILDKLFPIDLKPTDQEFARVITAKEGTPLRAFADNKGIWRYPVTLQAVSPRYIEALLNYEDRWFWQHPGINPFALLRAGMQNIMQQRIVSGGSTLTMQVARLIDPHPRTIPGKLRQVFRALQLEWRYNKQQILTYYLNHAPFGGPLEGVQAASYTYLGKSASELSYAEAALLTVLPQAPSRNRPDRYPQRARKVRDKVLRRLQQLGVWSAASVTAAVQEPVFAFRRPQPLLAPLLARRLKPTVKTGQPLTTTIDINLQMGIEAQLKDYVAGLPDKTSAAVMLIENRTMAVRVYAASADFTDASRFGHVDMIQALRSPGSTLKPFLYGLGLDEGLIHSQSLLTDAPITLAGYRPRNFNRGFSGPVSVSQALQRSLNIPAVQLLYQLGISKFVNRLKNGGLVLKFPHAAKPNLSVILGGVGTTLESLTGAYSALANAGLAGNPRFTNKDPLLQRRLLSPGAAWIIRKLLSRRPASLPNLAWKTGTSFGHRDFWSIGVTRAYTIGVWVGRPDGTPIAGHYGARTASPLLFTIAANLPGKFAADASSPPQSVRQAIICWPLGQLQVDTPKSLCHEQKLAWLLDNRVPGTFPDSTYFPWQDNPLTLTVNQVTGKRVDAGCSAQHTRQRLIAFWPLAVEPWILERLQRRTQMGEADNSCSNPPVFYRGNLTILGLNDHAILRPAGAAHKLPLIKLTAIGARGQQYWFINGQLLARIKHGELLHYQFTSPGRFQIAVSDESGNNAVVEIRVLRGKS